MDQGARKILQEAQKRADERMAALYARVDKLHEQEIGRLKNALKAIGDPSRPESQQ